MCRRKTFGKICVSLFIVFILLNLAVCVQAAELSALGDRFNLITQDDTLILPDEDGTYIIIVGSDLFIASPETTDAFIDEGADIDFVEEVRKNWQTWNEEVLDGYRFTGEPEEIFPGLYSIPITSDSETDPMVSTILAYNKDLLFVVIVGGSRETLRSFCDNILPADFDAKKLVSLGEEAYSSKDYQSALQYMTPAAKLGDHEAQFRLGFMYHNGEGVEQSYETAMKYYDQAAEQGNYYAQFQLGWMYEHGEGTEPSKEKALQYYQLAADQDYVVAQVFLLALQNEISGGSDIAADEVPAATQEPAADESADELYQQCLNTYWDGDHEAALRCFMQSAEQGNMLAQENAAYLFYNGDGAKKDIEKAIEYWKMAAAQGSVVSQYNVGVFYYNGIGIEKSNEEAVKYFRMAADNGHASAQNNLAWMYEHGSGVDVSYEKAAEYYQKAADQNHATSQNNLGKLYERGLGVPQSQEMALKYFQMAMDNLKVGDVIVMGSYEQDNDLSNGAEPVEWMVMMLEDDRALVASKCGLDVMPYHDTMTAVTWETSSLRSWLNGAFYEDSFSSLDKSRIMTTVLQNPDNRKYGTDGGNDTTDRIFLFDVDQAQQIIDDGTVNLDTFATDYAKARGAFVANSGLSLFWTRTPGSDPYSAMVIDESGMMDESGLEVNNKQVMIAPAFWLDRHALEDDLSDLEIDISGNSGGNPSIKDYSIITPVVIWNTNTRSYRNVSGTVYDIAALEKNEMYALRIELTNKTNHDLRPAVEIKFNGETYHWNDTTIAVNSSHGFVCDSGYVGAGTYEWEFFIDGVSAAEGSYEIVSSDSVHVGDIITLGSYEQDNNTNNGKEPIEWQVIAVESDRALVVSRYCLEVIPYNRTRTDVTWETCSLRQWLNDDFFKNSFSGYDQSKILHTTNSNPDNPQYGTDGGRDTEDRIFLLSIGEAEKYFSDRTGRMCKPTEYALAHKAFASSGDGTSFWFLRSPGENSQKVAVIYSGGWVKYEGDDVNDSLDVVRPAFWMKIR